MIRSDGVYDCDQWRLYRWNKSINQAKVHGTGEPKHAQVIQWNNNVLFQLTSKRNRQESSDEDDIVNIRRDSRSIATSAACTSSPSLYIMLDPTSRTTTCRTECYTRCRNDEMNPQTSMTGFSPQTSMSGFNTHTHTHTLVWLVPTHSINPRTGVMGFNSQHRVGQGLSGFNRYAGLKSPPMASGNAMSATTSIRELICSFYSDHF